MDYTDEEIASMTPEERLERGLVYDPEPTTGAPDAPKVAEAPRTAKRRVNDGPTGRARREATDQEGDLEADLDPGA